MKKIIMLVCFCVFTLVGGISFAVPITPHFNDYPNYIPTQDDLDATASGWFYTHYGITFDHAYMYTDTRDTFDGLGISNGWVAENNIANITGTIFFADTTDFVTIDWISFYYPVVFSVYDGSNHLLESFSIAGSETGTTTLSHAGISKLTFTSTGGYGGISALAYDYDGLTDGRNDDTNTVPEPSSIVLVGVGLAGLVAWRKKRN